MTNTISSASRSLLYVISVIASIVTIFALLVGILSLLRAGEEALGLAATLIGLATAIGTSGRFTSPPEQATTATTVQPSPNPSRYLPIVRIVLAPIVVIGGLWILQEIGLQRFTTGLRETSRAAAFDAISDASNLGVSVIPLLEDALEDALTKPVFDRSAHLSIAQLLADFQPNANGSWIAERACAAAARLDTIEAGRALDALAIVDTYLWGQLAGELNDAAAGLPSVNTPHCPLIGRPEAQTSAHRLFYAETVVRIDAADSSLRSSQAKSITQFNLATLLLNFEERTNFFDAAVAAYRDALAFNPENVEARFGLTRLMVRRTDRFDNPRAALDDAMRIAHRGWSEDIDPRFCQGQQNLLDESVRIAAWYCFGLRINEATAQIALAAVDDNPIPPSAMSILEQAITFAEVNDQFGLSLYTAAAYDTYARVLENQPDFAPDDPDYRRVLLTLIDETDPTDEDHRGWADRARMQLGIP